MKNIVYILILIIGSLQAQDEPFRGGPGDGFTVISIEVSFTSFCVGGSGDGFSKDTTIDLFNESFKGGMADGYATEDLENSFNDFFSGGSSDGFAYNDFIDLYNDTYSGSIGDGYTSEELENSFNDVFKGGAADGYSSTNYGHIIVWTGLVGTGWNVSGNWENGLIPTSCNPVIIPAGVPNFPFVNSGLLEIGEHNNDGDYRCQQLKINQNAELTTRVNCFVENRNLILIRGNFFVKNPSSESFKNLNGAEVIIKPTGELVILP